MKTQFITLTLPLRPSPRQTRRAIEMALLEFGQPLRWAITSLNPSKAVATVEAIVTRSAATETLPQE